MSALKSASKRRTLAIIGLVLSPSIVAMTLPKAIMPDVQARPQQLTASQTIAQVPVAQQERTLSVTGQGLQEIETTLSQVRLGVRVEARTAEAAQQEAAERQTAVVEYLRSQNVEDLATTGISLNPRYDYREDRRVLQGYEATNTISFRTATEAAGEIMDAAVEAGATEINGVSFVADDAAIAVARQQALETAVADAQQQADTVLSALGLSRQEIVNITIGSMSAPPPSPVLARAVSADAESSTTPVIGGTQTVNAQVTLVIRY